MNFHHEVNSKKELREFTKFLDDEIGTEYDLTVEDTLLSFKALVVVFDLEEREEIDLIINFIKTQRGGK